MGEVVIEVEKISKKFQLGNIGTGSLRQDFQYWWNRTFRKKDDPFFINHEAERNSDEYIWALRDITFQMIKGEALGIIGDNGAGKSTLLKIISRIVHPTSGFVRGKGKVSSILEVGTGFHYELSGRENIFNSGYTLGMNKEEIKRKFDEIVEFSGIEKFIDTPVKRYSSGMYLRLAFAVAAHLEPDILIVDEVLAVGDADFQKKCLGKMHEVSNAQGRTIIFVSHNMQAIANLCSRAIWLQKGMIQDSGDARTVVTKYIASGKNDVTVREWKDEHSAPGNDFVRMKSVTVKPENGDSYITVRSPIQLDCEFRCYVDDCDINVNVKLMTMTGECVFNLGSPSIRAEKGIIALRSIIPGNLLNNATYVVGLSIIKNHSAIIADFPNCVSIEVEDVREGMYYFGTWPGVIRPQIDTMLYVKEKIPEA